MDISNNNICHRCVGEKYLKSQVRREGKRCKCSYCGKTFKSVTLEWLAEAIHEAIEKHFYLTPDQPSSFESAMMKYSGWEREGDHVNSKIQEITEIDEKIADDVQRYLSDANYDIDMYKIGEENPYGDEALYEERGPDDSMFQESWTDFRNEIISRARFYSVKAESFLNDLFSDIHSLKTYEGESVVCTRGTNSKERHIYRARVAQSEHDIQRILKDPVNELGSPISRKARSGRMNAAGISVLYGAEDPETCIAEIRPPVGSHVVLGKFEIIRDIHLLDFDILTKVYVKGSYFDPKYLSQLQKAAFLRSLTTELIKPVMPNDEVFEYLPTQIIAEFLSEKIDPPIDGVIFNSSQTGTGKNVVLFNHSCKTEPYELPSGTEVSVDFGWVSKDDSDDTISIAEDLPKTDITTSDKETKSKGQRSFLDFEFDDGIIFENIDTREVTLRLDVINIEVKIIKSAQYKHEPRSVMRYRFDRNKESDF